MDLIDRQQAIDICDKYNGQGFVWTLIRNDISKLPSAQPERKTGRWVKDRLTALNGGSYEVFRCSECQSAFNWRMVYCGHCGAKMEEEA